MCRTILAKVSPTIPLKTAGTKGMRNPKRRNDVHSPATKGSCAGECLKQGFELHGVACIRNRRGNCGRRRGRRSYCGHRYSSYDNIWDDDHFLHDGEYCHKGHGAAALDSFASGNSLCRVTNFALSQLVNLTATAAASRLPIVRPWADRIGDLAEMAADVAHQAQEVCKE